MSWTESLESDPNTASWREDHGVKVESEKQRFLDSLRAGQSVPIIRGFFGPESKYSDAYQEKVIKPPEGGCYVKAYGCEFLYKGLVDRRLVFMMQLGKWLLAQFPKEVLAKDWLVLTTVGFRFLFRRRSFLKQTNFVM